MKQGISLKAPYRAGNLEMNRPAEHQGPGQAQIKRVMRARSLHSVLNLRQLLLAPQAWLQLQLEALNASTLVSCIVHRMHRAL